MCLYAWCVCLLLSLFLIPEPGKAARRVNSQWQHAGTHIHGMSSPTTLLSTAEPRGPAAGQAGYKADSPESHKRRQTYLV
jgi:hypothetical protein